MLPIGREPSWKLVLELDFGWRMLAQTEMRLLMILETFPGPKWELALEGQISAARWWKCGFRWPNFPDKNLCQISLVNLTRFLVSGKFSWILDPATWSLTKLVTKPSWNMARWRPTLLSMKHTMSMETKQYPIWCRLEKSSVKHTAWRTVSYMSTSFLFFYMHGP